ncbi:MAG: GNAT family N-acetyltransferase [Anaerolineales bacterium]|nr:GNAT family N-acetyltransferase [Anaerolineales bacterium]
MNSKNDHLNLVMHTEIPDLPDLAFRLYRNENDIPIIADIGQRCLDADKIETLWTTDEVARMIEHLPNFNPEKDVLFATIADEVVGYIRVHWAQELEGARIYFHNGCVLPHWRRKGIGSALLRFGQQRLRAIAAQHPSDGLQAFQSWHADTEDGTRALFEADGYEPARYSFEMERSLGDLPPEVPLPQGLELRPARPEHYRAIWEALDEAFQDHWGYVPAKDSQYEWWMKSPTFQPDLWKVAWDGDQVAGMVLNYIDHDENARYNRKRGYTEDICVRRPWRKQGLARALLIQSLYTLKGMGMKEACLDVDTENLSGALRLYQGVGFQAVKRYTTYRKPIS